MEKEESIYGFIKNTVATNADNETEYLTIINTFIKNLAVTENANNKTIINDLSNTNRTILKVINTNKLEPIMAKATFNEEELKINIEVTFSTNKITQILNQNGKELSNNSNTATETELLGNGTYKYLIIDNLGNIEEITIKVEGLKIYVIPDLKRLKEFRDEVNAGNNFSGITVIQTADIDITPDKHWINEAGEIQFEEGVESWEPIGNNSTSSMNFYGNYDGQGHTISGLYIDSESEYKYQGLFGMCLYGTIKNLNIKESKIISTGNNVGGIVGYASNSTIENCSNSGEVIGNYYVGGIAGFSYGIIDKCYNAGKVTATNGGVGGIVGDASKIEISNCYNAGEISSQKNGYAGGICGMVSNYSYAVANIYNCYNIGKINNEGDYTGGIIGEYGSTDSIKLNNNYNMGEINSNKSYVGGIIGKSEHLTTIQYCYNNALISGKGCVAGIIGFSSGSDTIDNCCNIGNITGTEEYIGGILGFSSSSSRVSICYNNGNIYGAEYVGGITGKSNYGVSGSGYNHNVIFKCYNRGNIQGNSYVGGSTGCYDRK